MAALLLVLLFYCQIYMFCGQMVAAQLQPRNVLLVVVDDLRPAIEEYGDKAAFTPNLNALMRRSLVYNHAFAQQALCAPSRTSFLTSRRPDTLKLYDTNSYWRKKAGNFTTLPQHFKNSGFFTHSVGKVFHPGISSNFSDDFPLSWSTKPFHPQSLQFENQPLCLNVDGSRSANLLCDVLVAEQPGATLPDLEILQVATDFLQNSREITKNKPFFLAVGFHKPHIPFRIPSKYLQFPISGSKKLPVNRWKPPGFPSVAWAPFDDVRRRKDIQKHNISYPYGPIPDKLLKQIRLYYYASVTYVDDLIGQLLGHVDNNTIIALIGDHGWSLGEHGELAKYSNFEVATRVPFILHAPDWLKGFVNEPIELVDLFPTLVDLTGVGPPIKSCTATANKQLCTEGRSLVHNNQPTKYAFSQYPRPSDTPTHNSDQPKGKDIKFMGYSVRSTQFRYTEWIQLDNKACVGRELYDHSFDEGEELNLSDRPQLQSVIQELSAVLKKQFALKL